MNISQHIQYAFQWMCVRYTVLLYQLEGDENPADFLTAMLQSSP